RCRLLLVSALVVTSLLGSAAALGDAAADVEAATQEWISAFNRKSAKDIVALYAKDAVLFGTISPVLRDSPERVWDYFKDIANLGDATISVGERRVQVFGDVAINTGFYTRSAMQDGKLV